MPPRLSALPILASLGLAMTAAVPAGAAGSNADPSPLDPTASMQELRGLCRDGSADTPMQLNVDANAILQRHDRAMAACNRLIEEGRLEGRDLVDVLLDRADLYGYDAFAQALADYGRAIALEPRFAGAYWRRGKANLLNSRNLPAALLDLDEAIRLDPSQAEFFVTRASIQGWLGQPDLALADLDHAVSLDPRSVHALTNRGLAYANKGDTARALSDFDAAIRLTPDDSGLYGFRSAARRQAGDEAGAKTDDEKMGQLLFGSGQ